MYLSRWRLHISKHPCYCNTGLDRPAICSHLFALTHNSSVSSAAVHCAANRHRGIAKCSKAQAHLHLTHVSFCGNTSAKLSAPLATNGANSACSLHRGVHQSPRSNIAPISCTSIHTSIWSKQGRGLELCSNQFRVQLAGTEVYINDSSRWHITLFHTSKFDDTRPSPLEPAANQLCQASAGRPLPSPAALQLEQEAMQQTVAKSEPLHVKVRLRLCMSRWAYTCACHGGLTPVRVMVRLRLCISR